MPIYAYKCESCGHRQDVLQKISDPLLTQCPACQSQTFVKQVTAAGFQLKGSGWYVTDFRDGGGKKADADAAKPSDAQKSESGDKAAASAEAKPSAKADSGSTDAGAAAASSSPAAAPAPAAPPSP